MSTPAATAAGRVRVGSALVGPWARTRADLGTVLVGALVVAVTAFLTVLLPGVVENSADDAVRAAVRDAGTAADTTITARFPGDSLGPRELEPDSAAQTIGQAVRFAGALPPALAAVVAPPSASVVTSPAPVTLPVGAPAAPAELRLAWLWSGEEPAVRWVAGGAPAGTPGLQVALAEDVAAALSVTAGDTLPWNTGSTVDLLVSGVFRPVDPTDPAWAAAPGVLAPRTSGQGPARHTDAVALLSDASLPLARLAVDPGATTRTYTLRAVPEALGAADVEPVAEAVAGLRAAPVSLGFAPTPDVRSRLGLLLLEARDRLAVARAQAAVLVVGALTAGGLALLLVARVLATRRRQVLATQRARGASLPALAVSLAVESVAVTAVGVAAGALLAVPLVAPHVAVGWLVPVAVLGLAAGPAGALPVPPLPPLRRVALEVVVLLLAVGGVVALRSRDVSAAAESGVDLLLAVAPTCVVVAGTLVLLRLVPLALRAALAVATRARSAVPLLSAARAATTAGRPLLFLLLTVAVGLATVTAALDATVRAGQDDGSWTAVGADVAVRTDPDDGLPALAERLASAPGVDLVVPARVEEVPLTGVPGSSRASVVVVDPAAYARLLSRTPLPAVPALAGLDDDPGTVRALFGPDLAAGPAPGLLLDRQEVPVTVTGAAPAAGTVVLSRDAVPDDLAVPNTLWVVGSGAARAVAAAPELADAEVTDRAAVLATRRAEPLTQGLTLIARVVAPVLVGLAVLGVLLGAAAGARERWATLAALRTLGLTAGQVRRITAGELLPPVLLAGLGGAALGVLAAWFAVQPLALRLLTGQATDPALVLPWPLVLAVVVPLPLTVGAVVAAEALARRRQRVGTVLRIGG